MTTTSGAFSEKFATPSNASMARIIESTDRELILKMVSEAAQRANCQSGSTTDNCSSCRKFQVGTQTMIEVVEPTDKPSIGIEQIRNQLKKLSLSNSRQNSQRFVLIQPAEMLTTEAQNALLKTLEEPPERTVIVLGVNQASRLLETVRSRCTTTTISSPQEKIAPAAAKFLADTPYQRLIQCKILADAKNDLQVFNAGLQRLCLAEATSKPATELRRQIAALELCRQQLAANVSRRSALEVLSLEL